MHFFVLMDLVHMMNSWSTQKIFMERMCISILLVILDIPNVLYVMVNLPIGKE